MLSDQQGYAGQIGTYEAGRLFRVIWEFDMDTGTYDVWLDGEQVVDDRVHGVISDGIGSVHFGPYGDSDTDGSYNVDAIMVTDYFQATPMERGSWGRIKARFVK
jgi:hypothetical protein